MLSGNLMAKSSEQKLQAPPDLQAQMMDVIKKMNAARIHPDNSWARRNNGEGYIDVVPYYVHASNSSVEIWEDLGEGRHAVVDYDSMFPINKQCQVVNFG